MFRRIKCWRNITYFILNERKYKIIYPKQSEIFRAFSLTPFHIIKVVILGQDPYHQVNQANGLAFSVHKGIQIPPSLVNIYKEVYDDLSLPYVNKHGSLENWAKQGVFLLNTILTVEHGKPRSHEHIGWKIFTNQIIQCINRYHVGIVFLLWGRSAVSMKYLIDINKHYILTAPHPSPLSAYRGFIGCRHFSKTNQILVKNNWNPINWLITSS
ncbi:MAG: uracil-DNA glycosylase [Buchnera aphidicola (Eriosoma harunire)]